MINIYDNPQKMKSHLINGTHKGTKNWGDHVTKSTKNELVMTKDYLFSNAENKLKYTKKIFLQLAGLKYNMRADLLMH
jgi:hypothetical protein